MFTLNPNQKEFQIIRNSSILHGVFFDSATGPITASRSAAIFNTSDTGKVREINDLVTEDIILESELDARYAQLGWPCPSNLPSKPWAVLTPRNRRTVKTEIWGSRRLMVQKIAINISLQDLCAEDSLVEAIEAALRQRTNALRIRALRQAFVTWGEMIPLNVVVGACIVASGKINGEATLLNSVPSLADSSNDLPNSLSPNNTPTSSNDHGLRYSLVHIVDQHLGTTGCFTRRLESSVQGGSSEALLREGYDPWLKSVIGERTDSPASWRIIKIIHAVPITDILTAQLRDRVEMLFTNSVILRSPSIGAPHALSFDGATNGVQNIQSITVWFSTSRIRDIAVVYAGGTTAGPYSYGLSDHESQSDVFTLTPGEFITDVFVWSHFDGWIMGLQFVKSSLGLSPIYGIRTKDSISSQPPALLSGNGNVLLGLSGAYTSDGLTQLQAVWRTDVIIRRQRHTQTSCIGGTTGYVFNDLQYLADPASSRIAQITARAGGKHGVAKFQTTYVSISGDALTRIETPPRGSDSGNLIIMTLEEDEFIVGVRGHHNNYGIQRIQFITNRKTHPAFGAETGDIAFSFDAPKTSDGREMVLHYMAGKSRGWLDAVLFVWAEMPLKTTSV